MSYSIKHKSTAFIATCVLSFFSIAAKRPATIGYYVHGRFIEMKNEDLCLAPNWTQPLYAYVPNSSYLFVTEAPANTETLSPYERRLFGNRFLDHGAAMNMREQYENMIKEQETRAAHDQWSRSDEMGFMDRIKNFSQHVMRNIFDYQINEGLKKAEKRSDSVRTFSNLNKAIESVVHASVNVEVSDRFEFGTTTNLRDQSGKLWVKSDYFDGSFQINLGEAWKSNESAEEMLKKPTSEFYQVQVSRPLPLWNLSSSLAYGGSTTNLTATLSRPIAPNLRGEIASARGLDLNRSTVPGGSEERVALFYDLRF